MASKEMESKIHKRKKTLIMSNDRALQLIQLIKTRECLWNKFHPATSNQSQVDEAWKEVSIKMQLPVDFLQQKWKSLQGTYRHVRAIHEKIIATASEANNVREPSWFAYESMLFLNQVSVSRVKAEFTNQQLNCGVTHEEQDEINEMASDIFADETKVVKRNTFPMTPDKTLQLIELIKNRKCLWNKYDPTFNNQSVDAAWKEVSLKMGLPVDFLQQKWKSLQGSYRAIKSIRCKSIAAASVGKSIRQRSWFAYESMLFLDQTIESRVMSSNQQSICKVAVEANSTHEGHDAINQEASDTFANEPSKISNKRTTKLTPARTLQLIQLIKNRKCLWNKYDPTANNQSVDAAWKEVSLKMGLPVDFLQQKWKSLQGSYRAIKSIRVKRIAAASIGKSIRQRSWFAYESMLFLDQVRGSRVKAESTNQQLIYDVTVEANSTHEEQDEINEEASGTFTNEIKHSDNIAIDTSITKTEGDSTYKEYCDINQEGFDIFTNEPSKISNKRSLAMPEDRTLQLILLVKNRECLWNRLHRTGFNRFRIANAWKEVSIKMQLPVDFVQRKWNSLQATYRQLKCIHTKRTAAASDGNSVRQPRWFAYRAMMFLNQVHASRYKRQYTIPEPIYQVMVEPNPTYEEHDETNQEVSDIFANDIKHSDNIAIDTSLTKTEGDTTYKEHVDIKAKPNANESVYGDNITTTNTASPESEGVRFAVLMARKLDNMSPIRRKRMILKLEKILLAEEEARFVEKYGPL